MGFEPTEAELTGPVFMGLSEPAKALWLRTGHWCAAASQRLVSLAMVKGWGSSKRAADELATAGLWVIDGGDWLVPERDESVSAKRARAGRLGGLAKASKQPSKPLANVLANSDFASLAKPGLVPPLASPSPEQDSGSDLRSSPDSSSFQPLSKPDPLPAREPKRRMRRCPDGFELDETGKKLCSELRVNWSAEGPKFRDWEFKDPKSDWQATARTWIRNAAGRSSPTSVPTRNGHAPPVSPNVDHDTRAALHASHRVQEFIGGLK